MGRHSLKHAWWAARGVEIVRRKLDTGDYWAEGSTFLVDTKKDVQELAGNVGRDHDRFVRELDRATVEGKTLVILVEECPEYNDRERLATEWVCRPCMKCQAFWAQICNPNKASWCRAHKRMPLTGKRLAAIITALEVRHGARFMFCEKADTARIVCDLLGVRYEE